MMLFNSVGCALVLLMLSHVLTNVGQNFLQYTELLGTVYVSY